MNQRRMRVNQRQVRVNQRQVRVWHLRALAGIRRSVYAAKPRQRAGVFSELLFLKVSTYFGFYIKFSIHVQMKRGIPLVIG